MNFGTKLRFRREELGMTQQDVAQAVGVSRATVQKWEKGVIVNVRRDKLAKLAAGLQVNAIELANWMVPTGSAPPAHSGGDSVRMLPLIGSVVAGIGGIAYEELEGYVPIPADVAHGSEEEYFCLRVRGDSMAPRLEEGDIVTVKKTSSVDSGALAVVIVDGEEGVIKRVRHSGAAVREGAPDSYWVELVSDNPYYPPRRFVGEDVTRVYVVGRAVGVSRRL